MSTDATIPLSLPDEIKRLAAIDAARVSEVAKPLPAGPNV